MTAPTETSRSASSAIPECVASIADDCVSVVASGGNSAKISSNAEAGDSSTAGGASGAPNNKSSEKSCGSTVGGATAWSAASSVAFEAGTSTPATMDGWTGSRSFFRSSHSSAIRAPSTTAVPDVCRAATQCENRVDASPSNSKSPSVTGFSSFDHLFITCSQLQATSPRSNKPTMRPEPFRV